MREERWKIAEELAEQWASQCDRNAKEIQDCVEGWLKAPYSPENLTKASHVALTARVWKECARMLRQPRFMREEMESLKALSDKPTA